MLITYYIANEKVKLSGEGERSLILKEACGHDALTVSYIGTADTESSQGDRLMILFAPSFLDLGSAAYESQRRSFEEAVKAHAEVEKEFGNQIMNSRYEEDEKGLSWMIVPTGNSGTLSESNKIDNTTARSIGRLRRLMNITEAFHGMGRLLAALDPDEIFVYRDETGKEEISIAEHGASLRLDAQGRISGAENQLIFTNEYSAPELKGAGYKAADEKADLYSVGAIVYKTLFGKLPARPFNISASFDEDIREAVLARPELGYGEIAKETKRILVGMLEPEPEERMGYLEAEASLIELEWMLNEAADPEAAAELNKRYINTADYLKRFIIGTEFKKKFKTKRVPDGNDLWNRMRNYMNEPGDSIENMYTMDVKYAPADIEPCGEEQKRIWITEPSEKSLIRAMASCPPSSICFSIGSSRCQCEIRKNYSVSEKESVPSAKKLKMDLLYRVPDLDPGLAEELIAALDQNKICVKAASSVLAYKSRGRENEIALKMTELIGREEKLKGGFIDTGEKLSAVYRCIKPGKDENVNLMLVSVLPAHGISQKAFDMILEKCGAENRSKELSELGFMMQRSFMGKTRTAAAGPEVRMTANYLFGDELEEKRIEFHEAAMELIRENEKSGRLEEWEIEELGRLASAMEEHTPRPRAR